MSVTTQAIERLRHMVVSGQVKAGDRLPPEKALASELGLSRSSLREAVRALSVAGLLVVRQGDGTFVTEIPTADRLDFFEELTRDRGLLEVYELRRILEPEAAAMAASRATPELAKDLRVILKRMDDSATTEDHVSADLDFHAVIASASGNATLAATLAALWPRTVRARIWQGVSSEGAIERTHQEHRMILRAIEARDATQARAAAVVHLCEGEQWLHKVLAAK
jgi:GntR family transcriptional repressor for pyruvate dehydrogenase complex